MAKQMTLADQGHKITSEVIIDGNIYLGSDGVDNQFLKLKFANRHGLIAGATGTGKTVSLQGIAEAFSKAGVPVFIADVKGDLSGIAAEGGSNQKVQDRMTQIGFSADYAACPAVFWDLFGQKGHPIRATISEMGPLLLSRLLQLNDVQEGVINVAFELADDEKLLLLDLADLRALLAYMAENSASIGAKYGAVAPASVGAIQRSLLVLEQQGVDKFFGEPALNINDFIRTSASKEGYVNILAADNLMQSPKVYSTFLLWLLSELFENLPEIGDIEKPKLVFFFDEAHLLFDDAPKELLTKITQLVRLIRSKGVGVYFVTQNPADIPDDVLGQLSNRVQHALRAFTPKEQKAVKTAAETFRTNPAFKTEDVITQLAVGEALVSTLDESGAPTVVARTLMRPPLSRVGIINDAERMGIINKSPVSGKYDEAINRESAYELLSERPSHQSEKSSESSDGILGGLIKGLSGSRSAGKGAGVSDGIAQFAGSILRSVVRQEAQKFTRGLLKSMLK